MSIECSSKDAGQKEAPMKTVTWTALVLAVLALVLAGFAAYEALSVQQSVFLDW